MAVEPSPCSGEDRAFSAPQKCPVSSESVYSHTEHSRAPPCTPTPQVPQHSDTFWLGADRSLPQVLSLGSSRGTSL